MGASNYNSDSTNTNTVPIMKIGEVIELDNSLKTGRIKVRIKGTDNDETDKSLIWCIPLIPRYLLTLPKEGELVLVFQYEHQLSNPKSSFKTKRFWVGPLISQSTKLDNQDYESARELLPDGPTKLKQPKIKDGLYNILYGDDDDIILQGRYNTDIIQKESEIWLRVGKFIEGKNTDFNSKDIGFIQLKYGGEKLKRETEEVEDITYITPTPEITIYVNMKTITSSGVVLSNKLPEQEYSADDVDRTELRISIYNIKTGQKIEEFENETDYVGTNSRQEALNVAKSFIDANKGKMWRIKSDSSDIIKIYKGEGEIAQFTAKPIEVKRKRKRLKLVKNEDKKASVINVVATKINFLSNADGANTFELANPKNLISDDEQEKINDKAHPLVYGDNLVEFLELVKKYVSSHVHPYHGLPSDPSKVTTDVLQFDLNSILNENIKSN